MKRTRGRTLGKCLLFLLIAVLAAGCLCACGKKNESRKLKIVTTIFPEYDWVMTILGDNPGEAEVTLLLSSGVDMHSFQPTAEDILKISTADIFIYVGGESDAWVKDALKNVTNKDQVAINMMDVLGDKIKKEELAEGMEGGDEDDEDAYDEHVWLSLDNADILTSEIAMAMVAKDPDNKGTYSYNLFQLKKEIKALKESYKESMDKAEIKTVLFGDRFPFRYLMDDCGISYYAAFSGCSAETEASFKTIAFLSEKIDELGLPVVLVIDGSDRRLAETIVQNTKTKDQKILTLNSMQSVTAEDIKNGVNYLDLMQDNYKVLKQALGVK